MRNVCLITTGGTIEKIYNEKTGELDNGPTLVYRMLGELRIEDTDVSVHELMSKDSLDMVPDDRQRIVDSVRQTGACERDVCDGVVVLHGTDTLDRTGTAIHDQLAADLQVPVILTGALRPFEMKRSDALQNLTEAIFATGVLAPGVYCVAHGRALRFPGVTKDRERGTFVQLDARA